MYCIGGGNITPFNMCSLGVKLTHTYCLPMNTAQLWWNYKRSNITKLQIIIAFHNIFSLACPNVKAPATYAHFLTFTAANLQLGNWLMALCAGLTVLVMLDDNFF